MEEKKEIITGRKLAELCGMGELYEKSLKLKETTEKVKPNVEKK